MARHRFASQNDHEAVILGSNCCIMLLFCDETRCCGVEGVSKHKALGSRSFSAVVRRLLATDVVTRTTSTNTVPPDDDDDGG